MHMRKQGHGIWAFVLFALASLGADPAAAYIGPGVGAGTIAAVLGVIAALGMVIVAVVWYPLKRLIKAMKSRNKDTDAG
ncbi:MAG: hypothetical protein AAF526_09705 [Pseudomonadota bacterium]